MSDTPAVSDGPDGPEASTTALDGSGSGRRAPDHAQFVVVAVLVVVGAFTILSTWNVVPGMAKADPLGPRFFPLVVGLVLFALAGLLTVATLRGDRGEEEGGEDVDLEAKPHWATVIGLAAVFALNVALVDFLGWAITGALLFAGCARVLGSRTIVRDLLIGAVLSVGTFYGFYVGLGVHIPPGILKGIL